MIFLHLENAKEPANIFLELTSRTNMQFQLRPQDTCSAYNWTAFLHTDNKQVETKIKSAIPFSFVSKKTGINLKKKKKLYQNTMDLHDENYKVSTKEIKDLNTWSHIVVTD